MDISMELQVIIILSMGPEIILLKNLRSARCQNIDQMWVNTLKGEGDRIHSSLLKVCALWIVNGVYEIYEAHYLRAEHGVTTNNF